jgi:hypothetical protein
MIITPFDHDHANGTLGKAFHMTIHMSSSSSTLAAGLAGGRRGPGGAAAGNAPHRLAGEEPNDYRTRLFRLAKKYLSPSSELNKIRADDFAALDDDLQEHFLDKLTVRPRQGGQEDGSFPWWRPWNEDGGAEGRQRAGYCSGILWNRVLR